MTVEITDELKKRVKARLECSYNLGKVIWVELDSSGNWYVHASTARHADRGMQAAHNAGRFYATASEVLK